MNKQIVSMVTLFSFWGCLCMAGCSRTGPVKSEPKVETGYDAVERVSKSMPEVEILTISEGSWKKVQLISLEGGVLKFRALSLSGAELPRIRVEEIAEIKQLKKKRGGMIGALVGLTPGVGIFIGLAANDPDPDEREPNLYHSFLIAAAGALVGGLIGIITDSLRNNPYNSYDFRTLSEVQKIGTLRKIMKI